MILAIDILVPVYGVNMSIINLKSTIIKNESKFNRLLVKAFQRRFRSELINGKIDKEILLITNKLVSIRT